MTHLLAISVGPVQEFIAAARRTRDLWFGSHLLSEVSRDVANSVESQGGKLIFPAALDAENVANVILAECDGTDPREIAQKAKVAAQACWRKYANEAVEQVASVIRSDVWKDQVDDVIEFYAAWVQSTGNYGPERARVMRLLAGRKNCRDFEHASELDAGLPKSSLDGQRATVLKGPEAGEKPSTYRNNWPKDVRRKLRVRAGEQLDVVGVVKRVCEGMKPYPSVARVAADVWIRGLIHQGGMDVLSGLAELCDSLPRDVIHRLDQSVYPQFKDFLFEGTILFRGRHHEWWEEADDVLEVPGHQKTPPEWYAALDGQLKAIEKFATRNRIGGEPNPYLAVLVADGDNMGAAISKLTSVNDHQNFSRSLAGFAKEAQIIVSNHNGVPIYAGGDDVLAFLPVHQCLDCARDLHDQFEALMVPWAEKVDKSLTLSAGIAIAHFMENLEDLREYGRQAERAAKAVDGKDALAVHLHKRGGAPVQVRAKWTENPDVRIVEFAMMLNQGIIPGKLPYELRVMAKLYEDERWPPEMVNSAIEQDVTRLISKKQGRSTESVRAFMSPHLRKMTASKLLDLAEELLVARQLAAALRQAGEDPQQPVESAS